MCIAKSPNRMYEISSAHEQEAHNLSSSPCVGGTNLFSKSRSTLCSVHQRKSTWPLLQCITIMTILERCLTTHSDAALSSNEQHDLRITQNSIAFIDYTMITPEILLDVNKHVLHDNKQTLFARPHSPPPTTCAPPSIGGWKL